MTGREGDKRLGIKTTGREDVASAHYAPYEPTPYPVLERLAQSGWLGREHRLLDYGCGKGRVVFYLAAAVGCQATGIDQSPRLIREALENRQACRAGDRVRLACCLAEQYPIGDENAFFFFNPFSSTVFEAVLRRLRQSWYANPRQMLLLCYYPSPEYIQCLEGCPEIRRLGSIDCSDLFRRNPRERIEVYALPEPIRP
ncbi:MAG TPA: class I SAM-dependent methyltransferase [Candidatus Excrementavichristensenella intestinipullorum]|nr:class I SAM-dependent methyltransferase [Candidatus Excrementavichristensenella intestinipullorum]